MTRFILSRHGHVEGIEPARFRGRLELPLTELGRSQAHSLADCIHGLYPVSAVYTSPMGRAVETGQSVASRFNLTTHTHVGLHDIDYGAWQGLTRDDASTTWASEVDTWFNAPHLARIPSGESLQAVLARATDALHDIAQAHPDETVVLVGHDSVNRVILMHALALPLSRYWFLRQDPCCINELIFAKGDFTINRLNETGHLHKP